MTGKLLGAALIGGGAIWSFMAYRRQLRRRRTMLRSFLQAVSHMETAVRWRRLPMTPLLTELAQWPCCGEYFAAILKRMEGHTPLHIAWKEVFAAIPDGDAADILCAVELTGDETQLLAALQYAQHGLRQLAQRRQEEDIRERRLTGAALLSAAGLLVILLI